MDSCVAVLVGEENPHPTLSRRTGRGSKRRRLLYAYFAAMRRVISSLTLGIFVFASMLTADFGSLATAGSRAYQYIRGRFWSVVSSAWAIRDSRIGLRWAVEVRCVALA